ncbi:MAG: right-handed parallel beta-helix repeat-containing protein, partial [Armatimonadota bacterium]|nr:right-handed parallel beta-helix repeat-containing protein [Armatimonadota bacterium]
TGSSLRGIGFAHYQQAVGVSAPNVTVENCAFVWNADNGLNFHPWSGGVKGTIPADGVVRGSTFTANGQAGLGAGQAPRFLVEDNTISYNNVEGFRRTWGAAGIKVIQLEGFECRRNLVEHNFAAGIWMDVDANKAVVHHNLVRHNQGLGIFFEISRECVIAFNICHDNGTGIQVSNATLARIYNNTLVNNNRSFYVQWWKRANNEGNVVAGIPRGQEYVTRDNVFKNNLVVYTRKLNGPVLEAQGGSEKSSARLTDSDYNAYYFGGEGRATPFARWAVHGGESRIYATFADFRQVEPNYERHSLLLEGAAGDPFFRDAQKGDFRLKAGSPALGKGEPLPPDVAAVGGSKEGEPVDMGALGLAQP